MRVLQRKQIIAAFRLLVRAMVRLALRNGVSCNEFTEMCKELYVDVASNDYGIDGRPTNMSRIALMTGINRHEVKRLKERLNELSQGEDTRDSYKIAGVLSAWHKDERYLNSDGQPVDLPLEGSHPSFSALVQSVSVGGDIAAVTVLRELKRSNTVEDGEGGKLKVKSRYYIPNYNQGLTNPPDFADPEKISFGCSMLVDHINTIFHNLYGKVGDSTRLELRATHHAINTADIPKFHRFVSEKSIELLNHVDGWLEKNHNPKGQQVERLGLGVYAIQGCNNTEGKNSV